MRSIIVSFCFIMHGVFLNAASLKSIFATDEVMDWSDDSGDEELEAFPLPNLSGLGHIPPSLDIPKAESPIKKIKLPPKKRFVESRISSQTLRIEQRLEEINSMHKEAGTNLQTGFSPAKSAKRSICLDSPMKSITSPSVFLEKKSKVKRVLNFDDDSSDPKDSLGDEVVIERLQAKIISSSETDFDNGLWALVDPLVLFGTVAFDSNNTEWDLIIEKILAKISFENQHDFLVSVMKEIYGNLESAKSLLIYKKDDEFVCRHYSTLALVIFSKIFANQNCPLKGKITAVSADVFDCQWENPDDGHVWNMVSFEEDNSEEGETQYFLDLQAKSFANISESIFLTKLTVTHLNDRFIDFKYKLTSRSFEYDYIRATKEKFDIKQKKSTKRRIQSNEESCRRALIKIVKNNFKYYEKERTIDVAINRN